MVDFKVYTVLDDGTPVLIRTLQPEDKLSIVEGFERISPHSRYLRYSSAGAKLTPADLDILTCTDETKCLSLGASDLNHSEHYGIGLARYIICKDEPDTAEIAMVVVDDYQGRGLGALLLDLLITIARKNGIQSLRAYVLRENHAMIRLLKRVNAQFRHLEGGMIQVDIPLVAMQSEKWAVGM